MSMYFDVLYYLTVVLNSINLEGQGRQPPAMSKGRLQQVDIPLKQEVNNPEEDFSNSKEEDLGIQALEEEVVETPPEEVEDNKHSLLEEEEAVTITVTRGISNVIVAINLGTIALRCKKEKTR